MAKKPVDLNRTRKRLMSTLDGIEAHRLLGQLLQLSFADAAPILLEYAEHGALDHVRTHTTCQLAKLVPEGDVGFARFFDASLQDPHLAYWGIRGLVRVLGSASFAVLTKFALDPIKPVEQRANAIREMAVHRGQHFIRGLPTDPGYGEESRLPLRETEEWAAAGFPVGPGFAPPERHDRLDNPLSPLDQASSRLDMKLAKLRKKDQDAVNPTNWLTPADPGDMAAITPRWTLPSSYMEFLEHFSPLEVQLFSRKYYQGLALHGAADLLAAQRGYSVDGETGAPLVEWPPEYVVIANHAGDPYVLDLSRTSNGDAPVLTASHGEGEWDFRTVSPSFVSFLSQLAR